MVNKTFWKGKKVLITGHTGFKGSWLSMLLTYLDAKVIGYALAPPTEPNLFNLCRLDRVVSSNLGDIRDFESLLSIIDKDEPEIIFHLAAQPLVLESYQNPLYTYQTNVIGTVHLFDAIRVSEKKSVRVVVNITTDKCYENQEWIWAYRENEPLGGYDPYSSSKACSEIVTAAYRNSFFNLAEHKSHNVAIASARAGNVIGGGDWASNRLIPDIVRSILGNTKISIRNPNAIRPWQHVLEPLTGYLLLAECLYNYPLVVSGAYNFGPDDKETRSVKWIVEKFCNKWPDKISYEIDDDQHHHEASFLRLDNSKAKKVLNWSPVWHIDDAIDRIVEFLIVYRNNPRELQKTCLSQINLYMETLMISQENAKQ
jgi:CDP-glucose 4,6-dehydratase